MIDIEILEDFIEGKIEPDKLENYKGGYKMGFFYTKDLQKAIKNLIQRNKDLEQIEQEHKEENGRLREENKNLEKELEEKDMQHELELIGKEEFTKANMAEIIEHYYTANENCIPISKLKEIVDECIPKKENIITKELEYAPNANDNSYLTQRILELLEESD